MAHPGGPTGEATTTQMLVVRHGQTTWNAEKRWQGRADSPLSALGTAQAEWAAKVLDPFDLVVTSNLSPPATRERSSPRRSARPWRSTPIFAEHDVGDWTGLTIDEIEEGSPGTLRASGGHPDGWEEDDDVATESDHRARAHREGESRARVLVITHGGLIRSLDRVLGLDSPYLANLGGLWVTVDGGGVTAGERVEIIDHAAVAATVPSSE